MPGEKVRVVVTDSNVLINLMHVGRCDDIFVLAIEAALVSIDEADADKHALEARFRFKMAFATFRDRVGRGTR